MASASVPLVALSSLCDDVVEHAAQQIETCPDQRIVDRVWKMIRDMGGISINQITQVMLVYSYTIRKPPEAANKVLSQAMTSVYNPTVLKKEYKKQPTNEKIIDYLDTINQAGVCMLAADLCTEVNYRFTRPVVCEFISRLGSGAKTNQLAKELDLHHLDDSQPPEGEVGWIPEATRLYNTIRKVASRGTKEGNAKKFYKEIYMACEETEELLKAFKEGSCCYDKEVVMISWMDEIMKIFSKPDYLEVQGISYQLLKNLSYKVTTLRNSLCKSKKKREKLLRRCVESPVSFISLSSLLQNHKKRILW
uniref:ML n=1 Tax=Tiliqua thogotovirus TaxID=2992311 RepID=A0A9E7V610_9ORTO|nr:ML [Tiliqua thogotovirus]